MASTVLVLPLNFSFTISGSFFFLCSLMPATAPTFEFFSSKNAFSTNPSISIESPSMKSIYSPLAF